MPITQVPGEAQQLTWILMPDFDGELWSGLHLQPSPVVQLQAIAIRYCNRCRQIEQDFFALVRSHADAATMTRVEVESQCPCGRCTRPMARRTMSGGAMHRHVST